MIGDWCNAEDGKQFAVHDPATGDRLAAVADCTANDSVAALDLAVEVSAAWATRSPRSRSEILYRAYEALIARQEEFALLITLEMGKPLRESLAEVLYGAEYLRWYAEEAVRRNGRITQSPDGAATITTEREPVGPCLLITPWNFPLALGLRKIAPALAAGCTAILKPADLTPLSSLLAAKMLQEAGLPPGVLSVITTTNPASIADALLGDARLRKLSFTGSTPVGQRLAAKAGPQLIRTSFELGGNAPLIVFADADLGRAVEGALVAKLRNGGQSCTAANRILVQDGIAEEFTEQFVGRLARTVVGRGTDPGTQLGPLIDDRAVQKASRAVAEARNAGAEVLHGGAPIDRPGSFFEPTALSLAKDGGLLDEELFAPIAPIVRFSSEAEAIHRAHSTAYGLSAYVFTESIDRAERVASGLNVGMVGINQGLVSNVAAPFGGIKLSGLGREGAHEGLEEYLNIKYVARTKPRAAAE